MLVDDAQWLDGPSAAALLFAARRLLADAVAVIVAVRTGEPSAFDGAGLDDLDLEGLPTDAARMLLDAHAERPVAADTAAWLHAATGGNPLALTELAGEAPRLRPAPVGDHVTVGSRIEHALSRRLDSVGPEAHGALLAAAVADDDALGPVLGAGATVEALESAEAAGLVSLSRAASCSGTRSCAPSCWAAPSRPTGAPRTAPTAARWVKATAPSGMPPPGQSRPTRQSPGRSRRPASAPPSAAAMRRRPRRSSTRRASRPTSRAARSGCCRRRRRPGSRATGPARWRCSARPTR